MFTAEHQFIFPSFHSFPTQTSSSVWCLLFISALYFLSIPNKHLQMIFHWLLSLGLIVLYCGDTQRSCHISLFIIVFQRANAEHELLLQVYLNFYAQSLTYLTFFSLQIHNCLLPVTRDGGFIQRQNHYNKSWYLGEPWKYFPCLRPLGPLKQTAALQM